MFEILKRAFGQDAGEEDDESDSTDPVITEHRLVHRSFVDDNGWETVDSWKTWKMKAGSGLPVGREELHARLGPDDPPGHYKLFNVDEHGQLRSTEWGLTHGSEEEARRQKRLREQRESTDDEDDTKEETSSIPPEMWAEIQRTWANTDGIFEPDDDH